MAESVLFIVLVMLFSRGRYTIQTTIVFLYENIVLLFQMMLNYT